MRYMILVLLFATPPALSGEVKIVLWNANALFDVAAVDHKTDDLRAFGEHF